MINFNLMCFFIYCIYLFYILVQYCTSIVIHVWEHPTVQTHNRYSFGQRGNIPRSNTQFLLLQPNSSNSYSFGQTALILIPSVEQLQSLLPNPCSNDTIFILNGNSSWRQKQSQGINTGGTACQSQSQLCYYSSTSRYHASTLLPRLTPPAVGSAALQPTMKALSASLHITCYRLSVQANQHGPRRQPPPYTVQKRPLSGPWLSVRANQCGPRRQPPPYTIQKWPLSGPRLAQCWYRG
jgi:hypothetical protein